MKRSLKKLVRRAAGAAMAPELASTALRSRLVGRDRAVESSTQLLAAVPGVTGEYLRAAYLRSAIEYCADEVCIGYGVLFSKAGARIEENVYIGPRCHIGLVHIERDVLLAAGVHVTSGANTHGIDDLDTPIRDQPGELRRVRIGAGAWVGSGAVIMADVGRGTVVAAGAVVTKPLPDNVIAGGIPARVIRRRDGQPLELVS